MKRVVRRAVVAEVGAGEDKAGQVVAGGTVAVVVEGGRGQVGGEALVGGAHEGLALAASRVVRLTRSLRLLARLGLRGREVADGCAGGDAGGTGTCAAAQAAHNHRACRRGRRAETENGEILRLAGRQAERG